MYLRSRMSGVLAFLLPVLALVWVSPAHSAHSAALPETETVLLVAKPDLRDPI